MEKVMVTGGAGFIGSHLVDRLVEKGYEVHVVDNLYSGNKKNVNPRAVLHIVDIRDKNSLIPLFENVKYVFHEAAIAQVQYSIENPTETNEVNVVGLLNVLEASRLNKVKRIIFASSCAIYGNQEKLPFNESMLPSPLSPYAVQKNLGEIYLRAWAKIYKIETVSLRYFNVYGPRQRGKGIYAVVIAKFIDFKKRKLPLTITGNGNQTRDYINVKDVVEANILAMNSLNVGRGEVINIGSSKKTSINNIAKLIGGSTQYVSPRLEMRDAQADILKAKELLNWEPKISLKEGIKVLLSGKD